MNDDIEKRVVALLDMEASIAASLGSTTRELKDWIFAEIRRLRGLA